MNDPKAMELLQMAQRASACAERLAPYEAKAAAGNLQMSDVNPQDAIWVLAAVKLGDHVTSVKNVAKAKK
jgi:hypothetical protein